MLRDSPGKRGECALPSTFSQSSSYLPRNNFIQDKSVYRKGRSTETALHSVIATIEKSLSLKEYTLIAFLDIEGAFNNVFPEAITGALLDLGIEGRLVGLISQLLKCRAVTSSLGSSTLTRLLCDIEGGGCQLVAYADDVAMIFTGKYPQTLCDLMTVKLINLAAWADKCGLGVNPDKTELVLFSRRYKEDWSLEPPGQPDALAFYTDGSKLNNKVGGGVHSPILGIDHSFRLPDHCSVFQAEILAINESLKLLQRSNTAYGRINIYSDSQAAIKSIAATTTKSTSVSNCRRSLHEMAEFFDICLIGYQGIKISQEIALPMSWPDGARLISSFQTKRISVCPWRPVNSCFTAYSLRNTLNVGTIRLPAGWHVSPGLE
ncbi:hypothetical protein ACLKA6_010520 [Drosophila palustris]